MSTVVDRGPILPADSAAANVVLKALSTRDCGRAAAMRAAAELSAATVRESKVSKFSGLVITGLVSPGPRRAYSYNGRLLREAPAEQIVRVDRAMPSRSAAEGVSASAGEEPNR
jgi:hypothetical protein